MSIAEEYQRRKVRYQSLEELRLDIDFFAHHEYVTVGNWSYAQILTHLAKVMNASFDGFPFLMPWPIRVAVRLIRKPILRTGFPSGFKAPKKADSLMPSASADLETALEEIHKAILRLQDHVPNKPHAVFGLLSYQEWVQLHLRHAELHMSFVVLRREAESNE